MAKYDRAVHAVLWWHIEQSGVSNLVKHCYLHPIIGRRLSGHMPKYGC